MVDRCEVCGKRLVFQDTIQCVACNVSRRAKAGIEGVREYLRDGETEKEFISRLEEQCPQCSAMLDRPGVPGKLGCPACEWTNPYTLLDTLGTLSSQEKRQIQGAAW